MFPCPLSFHPQAQSLAQFIYIGGIVQQLDFSQLGEKHDFSLTLTTVTCIKWEEPCFVCDTQNLKCQLSYYQ
jgi:hypothetical protein